MSASLQRFLRGIAHKKPAVAATGYRELLTFGNAAIGLIERRIRSVDWSVIPTHLQTEYLTAMLGVVEEIHPTRCAGLVAWLRSRSCDARVAAVISRFEKRADAHHDEFGSRGLQLMISREIEQPKEVFALVKKWLHTVPDGDLDGISRIDVIPDKDELDYWGSYSLYFSAIRLTWEKRWRRWPMRSIHLLVAETTLYHEIGHHALKHTIGGQDDDQEKEADGYSRRQWLKAHPEIVNFLRPPVRLLRSLFRALT